MTKNDLIVMRKYTGTTSQYFDKRRLGTLLRKSFATTDIVKHYSFSEVETLIDNTINDLWEGLE